MFRIFTNNFQGKCCVLSVLLIMLFAGCDKGVTESSGGNMGKNQSAVAQSVAPRVGFMAPDFSLPDLNDNMISLSDYKGKVVMVNFWATWCGPCKMEMPAMQHLEDTMDPKQFVILAISNDNEGKTVVKPYISEYGYTFSNLIDKDFKINDLYRVTSIPTTLIIDQDGVITNKFFGARNWTAARYRELLLNLINAGKA